MGAGRVVLGVAGVGAAAAGAVVGVRWMNAWGSTPAEAWRAYPGDDLVAPPVGTSTMAVTVHAPAEAVWRWLVQIGQDRGGMYSYDWLENAIGLDIHSATRVRDEWQHLAPGEEVRLVPPGWAGMRDGYAFRVARVEPPRLLVLRQAPPEHPWDGVWTFAVQPLADGTCRLISHTCTHRDAGFGAQVLGVVTAAGVPVTWFMTRKMLLTIKARAESAPPSPRTRG